MFNSNKIYLTSLRQVTNVPPPKKPFSSGRRREQKPTVESARRFDLFKTVIIVQSHFHFHISVYPLLLKALVHRHVCIIVRSIDSKPVYPGLLISVGPSSQLSPLSHSPSPTPRSLTTHHSAFFILSEDR